MATSRTKKVTSGGEVIGVAEAPDYSKDEAGLAEAVKVHGAAFVVERFCAQIMTDSMNRIRSEFNSGPTEETLQQEAKRLMATELSSELQNAAGDVDAVFAIFEKAKELAKQQWESRKAERIRQAKEAAAKLTDDAE